MAIIPDAFTTGFEEHMSTFSQEGEDSCEVDSCGWVWAMFRMLWLEPWEGHLWFELTLYFVTLLLIPPFLRYCFV